MKRTLIMGAAPAGRSLRVLLTSVMLSAVLAVTAASIAPSAAGAAPGAGHDGAASVFYTTSGAGNSLPNGAEIFAITVRGATVTTRDVGPTHGGDCGSLALSPHGTLYSMCGPLFGAQQLATINKRTGRAHLFGVHVRGLAVMALAFGRTGTLFGAQQLATINQRTGRADLFGVPVPGLAVMAMAFGPSGTLYAVGDCNPAPATFECTPGSDPTYNSLYKVNLKTGAFTRIGSTGAPQFFMDLTFDHHGNMLGETSTVNPSLIPAILYRINPTTGKATKLVNLVGSNTVMGLAFGRDGKLYATDFTQSPGLYRIDTKTGFETAIAALPFGFSSGLELMSSGG